MVARLRLIERLTAVLTPGCKLALISAPAGFGKSTLVSEWLAAVKIPIAWLSLDERDGDPAQFITYLVEALQKVTPGIGGSLQAALQSPQPLPIENILTLLINEISLIEGDFLIVLDDYHWVDSPPVDQALAFLIDHQPPQMHLVITTREDPNLPLARLRARRHCIELRAADLRFSASETAEFLNRIMKLSLSEREINALETRTEGWIAGLQMAALSMQGQADTASFIKSFTGSHRFVLDYLMEEVLNRQPPAVQSFLLRTSILDRLCGPLCGAVLGASPALGQETLEYLERANLFIVSLDQERRWYRYHHLFSDLLRQRLGQPQELAEDHLRASVWYEANHDLAEAFQHALAAGDFVRAAHLTEAAWQGMERNFQTTAWLGWVKKLPPEAVRSHPWLCVHIGWAYSDIGELEPSETHLQYAERALAEAAESQDFQAIPTNIALIRAGNAQIEGNLPETVRYAKLALQLIPKGELLIRSQAAITLGFTQWAVGEVEASLQAMLTWMDEMQQLGNQMYVIASAFVVADMQGILGHLGEAEKALQQTLQKAAALGPEAEVVTAHHHLGLAMLAHERGDDAERDLRLQKAAELGPHTTLIDWQYRWGLARARLKESAGEWDAALQALDEARQGYIKNPIPILQPIESRKARIHLKQGRVDQAQAWARERGLSVTDPVNYLCEYEVLTLVRVRLAEGSLQGVGGLLERLLALAETQKRTGSLIEILLTQALVYQAQGSPPQASLALERALTLAEPESYLRIFIDEGQALRALIEKLPRSRDYPLKSYADWLLVAFASSAAAPKSTAARQKYNTAEPLSERELEVLKLLRSELSGPEMAAHLVVSLNTLRTHTKNIFNKLGVTNRRAAVRRAEELELF
ncbi:ATP-dependent transcriptional regulator [Levilinea saccharolytica]|nr:ATP-dependent transcriptional regulator [Levilinea saccharolytica]